MLSLFIMGFDKISRSPFSAPIHSYDHPNVIWALPLSPSVAWWATPNPITAGNLARSDRAKLRRLMNQSSVSQAEEMVIAQTLQHRKWIEKHLHRSDADDAPLRHPAAQEHMKSPHSDERKVDGGE